MNEIHTLLEQLHDIEGLDSIHIWPLAIGWWILLALIILVLLFTSYFFFRWITFRRSWKYDTLEKLNQLLDNLSAHSNSDATIHSVAVVFSDYLRRIALRKFSRKICAGLTGMAWLEWLNRNDLKNFDWVNEGKLLIYFPYSPSTIPFKSDIIYLNNRSETENRKEMAKSCNQTEFANGTINQILIAEQLKKLIHAAKEWVR